MKRLRIGIFPFSRNLSHPADRRRIVSWAKKRNHELCLNQSKNVDLLYISEGCDFIKASYLKGPPKIFDLVDGYLAPQNLVTDLLRGSIKSLVGQHKTYPRLFRSIVKRTCLNVDLVVCSSEEQKSTILPFNPKVEVILDNHSEFPFLRFHSKPTSEGFSLFWEGTTHTLGALEKMVNGVKLNENKLNIVTDLEHPLLLGRHFKQSVAKRLNKSIGNFNFASWSVENVVRNANQSNLAVLPIDDSDNLQLFKPENRLLIMFRLGLPCLTSDIYSYRRVEKAIGSQVVCRNYVDWLTTINFMKENLDLMEYQVAKGQEYLLETHTEEILFEKWDKAIGSIT
jgi:hypothetical protein